MLKVALVGAGEMGRHWMRVISESADVELVGLADLNLDAAMRATASAGVPELPIATTIGPLAEAAGAQAVINVTVPAAHHPVTCEALFLGLPVLCEKPAAPDVATALSLVAASEATGQLLMISQSRRYFREFASFTRAVRNLGAIGSVTTEFFRAPHFGGFREEMPYPLLVDMAIHSFDAVRYLLDADPVAVYCDSFNPSWSWYQGDAATTAIFEFEGGARFTYTGSWCSPGLETSWNGRWRVSADGGSALWDGEGPPVVDPTQSLSSDSIAEGVAGALAEFVSAVRTGLVPSGEIHENVLSLAMVEAAVRSADTGQRVLIADVLDDAYAAALAAEQHPEALIALKSWGNAATGLQSRRK